MSMEPDKCLVCEEHTPDGTIFQAHGNYGSGVFDPTGWSSDWSLRAIVCDDCMLRQMSSVLAVKSETRTVREVRPWSPDDEEVGR